MSGRIEQLTPIDQALYQTALAARKQAYAPYSTFSVGAAVRTKDGRVYQGCNIENAAFGSTMCAERVALFGCVAQQGVQVDIDVLLVVADYPEPVPPCGSCRQVLSEFSTDARVILTNTRGMASNFVLSDLLPFNFKLLD